MAVVSSPNLIFLVVYAGDDEEYILYTSADYNFKSD